MVCRVLAQIETEHMNLKTKITDLRCKIEESKSSNSEYEKFIIAIRRFMQMDKLTALLLQELIAHIDVFKTEGTAKAERKE